MDAKREKHGAAGNQQDGPEHERGLLTAHFTPTIHVPAISSPFFRTARAASHWPLKPILKKLAPGGPGSGSLVSPRDWNSFVAESYLSGG